MAFPLSFPLPVPFLVKSSTFLLEPIPLSFDVPLLASNRVPISSSIVVVVSTIVSTIVIPAVIAVIIAAVVGAVELRAPCRQNGAGDRHPSDRSLQ
jgi:hypothetical protein